MDTLECSSKEVALTEGLAMSTHTLEFKFQTERMGLCGPPLTVMLPTATIAPLWK